MNKPLVIALFTSSLMTGCATSISNNTVLKDEESILMLCKAEMPFILTQQVKLSPEAVVVKTLPVPKGEKCALIKDYDPEVLITNFSTNNGNKDRPRVDFYKLPLLPGNLINEKNEGYKVVLEANAINYIGHVNFDSFDGKQAKITFLDKNEEAKNFIAEKGISKFKFVKAIPTVNPVD